MKILLIMPPGLEAVEPFKSAPNKPSPFLWGFPLGLGYLSAYLKSFGYEVQIIDCLRYGYTLEQVGEKIKEINPDVVGLNIMTPLAKTAVAIAKIAKEVNPAISVIGGGPHATYDYDNLLKKYNFDYIVMGEGELTFLELADFLSHKKLINEKDILGISFKNGNEVIVNSPRPLIENLDILPFPDRDSLNFKDYIVSGILPNAVEIIGSRGCSHRCIFCSSSHFFGRWRARSPENIIKELKYLIEKYPRIQSFLFFDDNFSLNKARVITLCEMLIKEGLDKYQWDCLARVDQVNEEVLKLMKRAGCTKINYGIESGSPVVLKNINKNLNLDVAKETIRLTKKIGMEALAFFMIGNPGETRETIKESIKFAKELNPTTTIWGITQIYPGTGLATIQPIDDFINYIYEPELTKPFPFTSVSVPNFINPGLGREELKKIYIKIFRYFTIYHFIKDPIGRIKRVMSSPKKAVSFLFSLFKRQQS